MQYIQKKKIFIFSPFWKYRKVLTAPIRSPGNFKNNFLENSLKIFESEPDLVPFALANYYFLISNIFAKKIHYFCFFYKIFYKLAKFANIFFRVLKDLLPVRFQTVMTSATLNGSMKQYEHMKITALFWLKRNNLIYHFLEDMTELKRMFVVGKVLSLKLKVAFLKKFDQKIFQLFN